MERLLRLQHWQLFLFLVGTPLILQIVFTGALMTSQNPALLVFLFPIIMLIFTAALFGWFYALGTNLHKKLPEAVKMNLTRFKVFLFVPAAYIVLLCLFIYSISNTAVTDGTLSDPGVVGFIVPVHLFSIFCIFYCLHFNAKALKSVELQKPVTFSDFSGDFFLLWFYPVGVWILQPRINNIFDESQERTNDLFS